MRRKNSRYRDYVTSFCLTLMIAFGMNAGVCYANPASRSIPGQEVYPFLVGIIWVAFFVLQMALFFGLFLLLWKLLVRRKAQSRHGLKENLEIFAFLILGFFLSHFVVGIVITYIYLRKAAIYFFDEFKFTEDRKNRIEAAICVWTGAVIMLVMEAIWGRPADKVVYILSLSRVDEIEDYLRTFGKSPVSKVLSHDLFFQIALAAVWTLVLLFGFRKKREDIKARIPEITMVYAFLLLGYLWSFFACGILLNIVALRMAIRVFTGKPLYNHAGEIKLADIPDADELVPPDLDREELRRQLLVYDANIDPELSAGKLRRRLIEEKRKEMKRNLMRQQETGKKEPENA